MPWAIHLYHYKTSEFGADLTVSLEVLFPRCFESSRTTWDFLPSTEGWTMWGKPGPSVPFEDGRALL